MREHSIHPSMLHGVVAVSCTLMGDLMLVVPQQFDRSAYALLRPYLPWAGLIFLVAGSSLAASAFSSGRLLNIVGRTSAAVSLLSVGTAIAASGDWSGAGLYLTLGIGILLSLRPRPVIDLPRGAGESLGLAVGSGALLSGLLRWAETQWSTNSPDALTGIALAMAGSLLLTARLLTHSPELYAGTQLVASTVLFAVAQQAIFSHQALPAGIIYGVSALGVLLTPWAPRLVHFLSATSLRTRLALALALITTLPLILGTAVMGEARERAAAGSALKLHRTQAETLAAYVGEFIASQRAAVAGLAARDEFLSLPPAAQERQLRALNAVYADVTGFSTYDNFNRPLARSDGRPPTTARDPFVSNTREHGSAIFITISVLHGTPVFAFGSAFRDDNGSYLGMAASIVENARISEFLKRQGEGANWRAYLTDEAGRTIAHPDTSLVMSFADISTAPPLAAMRQSADMTGSVQYNEAQESWLAGYARVPELGWSVVVERPVSAALADVHRERELMFGVLLIVLMLAAILGWMVAGRLVAPLQALARALAAVAEDGAGIRPPQSTVRELQDVANMFEAMAIRLAARTTERDQVEHALRELNIALEARVAERTADLNAALSARDEFLSIAAHELRTPITALRGVTQLMLRAQARGRLDAERINHDLMRIEQASGRLAALTNDLLDVSRLQSGQLQVRLSPANLVQLVQDAVDRHSVRDDDHHLLVSLPEAPALASVDTNRLDQVLENLLENALKYSPNGGPVEVRLTRQDDGLLLQVRDQGIGVPDDALEQIFEPFGRAPNAMAHRISGMGLGLYICRRIIEQHGGRIWAESAGDRQGLTMSVWLPALRSAEPLPVPLSS